MTASPPAASRRAIARPMPRLPPVTRTERLIGRTSGGSGRGLDPGERTGWLASAAVGTPRIDWPAVTSSADQRWPRARPPGTGSTLSSPRSRCARWPTPRCSEPRSWARSTPTSAPSGSGASRSACRTANLETLWDADDLGLAVRVVVDGTWGFASAVDLTPDAAARAAAEAVEVARVAAAINTERIELAPEPAHGDVSWVSAYEVDPFGVSVAEKIALLADWSAGLLARDGVDHVDASLLQVKEYKFYADGATTATQQRVRLHPSVTAVAVEAERPVRDDAHARPAGRPRLGVPDGGGGWASWDFAAELAEMPELLAAKLAAPSVEAGRYDLVIDPSNLWLTIHESIGHATELDRALGYEAAYAGTSFATLDQLGRLQYGSPVMHVTGDRTVEHGLATIGYDDEGVAGAVLGPDHRRRADRLPAGPADGPAAGARPLERLRVRRLPRAHADPADGQRLAAARARRPVHRRADRRAWSAASTSSATRAGRSTCSGTTSSSPASGSSGSSTAGSPASSGTSPTRRRPPTSGARWRPSAGRRPTCSAARSTAARASPARSRRSATAARRCSCGASGSSTPRRRQGA